jgi:hypothetical protein
MEQREGSFQVQNHGKVGRELHFSEEWKKNMSEALKKR